MVNETPRDLGCHNVEAECVVGIRKIECGVIYVLMVVVGSLTEYAYSLETGS